MDRQNSSPKRFIGLDAHKYYLVATGLDADLNQVYGPQRVELSRLDKWIKSVLKKGDKVALEMSTNTWDLYDEIRPHVQDVVIAHPPHVTLITGAKVMNDKKAAYRLAKLLAKDMLDSIWVPPIEVRELRALIAQRTKMTRLSTQAKNRLHSLLQRHHMAVPEGDPFSESKQEWWLNLSISEVEKINLRCNLETLIFAKKQLEQFNNALKKLAAKDPRAMHLFHLPGIGIINAMTILGAIGDIQRFKTAKDLVGYSGLGASVHDSGQTRRSGRITKQGRRDLRGALVEAAQVAANTHPFWKKELKQKEPRIGRNKAIVSIARRLLVIIWHVLTKENTDRHAYVEVVARKYLKIAYILGKEYRLPNQTAAGFVREHLDRLNIGANLTHIPCGSKKKPIPLPPTSLAFG